MVKANKKRDLQAKRLQKMPSRKITSVTDSTPQKPTKAMGFKITTRLSDESIKQSIKMISILEGKKDYEVIEEALREYINKKLQGVKVPKLIISKLKKK